MTDSTDSIDPDAFCSPPNACGSHDRCRTHLTWDAPGCSCAERIRNGPGHFVGCPRLPSCDCPCGYVASGQSDLEVHVGSCDADPLVPSGRSPGASASSFHVAKETAIAAFERDYAADLLALHGGNVSASAKATGLSRTAVYALFKRAGIALGPALSRGLRGKSPFRRLAQKR